MDTFAKDRLPPREAWPALAPPPYPDRLNAAVELLGDHSGPAVRGESTWSYDELNERSDAIAARLGIEPGTRVLLHSANTPEAIAAWLGILKAGGIVVATMPLLRAGEIAKVIDKAHVTHAITEERLAEEVVRAGEVELLTLHELPATGSFDAVDTTADDVAIIAFTSGTTGAPKGCVHFHRDLLATCDTFSKEILRPQSADVFSGTPPLAFTFGLGGHVLFPLRAGASTAPVPAPDRLAGAIAQHGITTLFTAPTGYRALLKSDADLSSLHTCVSAGGAPPARGSPAGAGKNGSRTAHGA